jgi:hypothetical protein
VDTSGIYSACGTKSFKLLMEDGWKIRSIGETEWRECKKEASA